MADAPVQSVVKIQTDGDLLNQVMHGDAGADPIDFGDGGEPVPTLRSVLADAQAGGRGAANLTADQTFQGSNAFAKTVTIPPGTHPTDAVNLTQLNAVSAAGRVPPLAAIRVIVTAVNLAAPGANLDGLAMANGDRFGFWDTGQTPASDPTYGLYSFNGAATPATRCGDANSAAELELATVFCGEGTYANETFQCHQLVINLGVTSLSFVKIGDDGDAVNAVRTAVHIQEFTNPVWVRAFADQFGFVAAGFRADGTVITPMMTMGVDDTIDAAYRIYDRFGFYVDMFGNTDAVATADDVSTYAARNTNNVVASAAVKTQVNTVVNVWSSKYNHFIGYGQSLMQGYTAWPGLSTVAYDGNVMVGTSVRPLDAFSTNFVQQGSSAFHPLVISVDDYDGGDAVQLSPSDILALGSGDLAEGETVINGWLDFGKMLFNQANGIPADANHLFIGSAVGVGGRAIEELVSGASTNYWGRVTGVATAAKVLATAAGASYGIAALVYMQGENNGAANNPNAHITTKAGYKTQLGIIDGDFHTEVVTAIAGQSGKVACFIYQTNGTWTTDAEGADTGAVDPPTALPIQMAQWEFTQENPHWALYSPSYPVTDNGGHLDANGSRWLGMQLAKVSHRVVKRREFWKPLSPRASTVAGNIVAIDFHVPEPPLVFDSCYVGYAATMYDDRGFTVYDDLGTVPISAIRVVFDTIVEIKLARAPSGETHVLYADGTVHSGNGNLRDSDPFVASENFEYTPGIGQRAGADIPALIDEPYPLWNWCIAFNLKVQN